MVIAKICAGLGNQMFQYATARDLAHRLGTSLKLDISSYTHDHHRRFELDRFQIAGEIASPDDVRALTGLLGTRNGPSAKAIRSMCRRRLGAIGRFITGPYIQETSFHFDPAVLSLKGDIYLHGRWQSEKYFADSAEILKREFQLRAVGPEDQEMARRMTQNGSSVSLHIRRGDYVTLSQQAGVHTLLPMEYYEKAIAHIASHVARPELFLFSDDPSWVQDNLPVEGATLVVLDGADRGPRELVLMSKCRHHVIANSTFSWWGAWLSQEPDGIVCAPRQWFRSEAQDARNTGDLLSSTWTVV